MAADNRRVSRVARNLFNVNVSATRLGVNNESSDSENKEDDNYKPDDNEISSSSDVNLGQVQRLPESSPPKSGKKRWKQRTPSSYQRNKRKRRRNEGREYFSEFSKKNINVRIIGPPCSCKKECKLKVADKEQEIFNNFWDLSSYDLQNMYLFGCIKVE
ncbi:hypothetical protein ABEB36_000312 [Hypothenemus hampei]|uniref:Uncharacterized protein n=1 Tax=Hypothenemus hampei TaxID=57062 RepID=A0ABD1FEG4_HYPHA